MPLPRHLARMIPLALLATTVPTRLAAQQAPTVSTLSPPQAEFAEPFSSLSGLRELSDGRVLVADRLEKAVRLLDLRSGTFREIGRVGPGPGEYQMPGGLLPLPADSTLLVDFGNMRLTVIEPSGRMGESWSMLSSDGEMRNPSGVDRAGHLYFTAMGGFRPGSDGPPDSIAILKWNRAAEAGDTVASLPSPESAVSMRSSGGGGGFQLRGMSPLAARYGWAVDASGQVAVVWPEDYHVEWIDPRGKRRASPPVRYDPVRVTEEDKKAWADGMANATGVMIAGGSASSSGARTVRLPRPDPADMDWPAVKPPFEASQIRFAPDGSLWVQRYVKHGAPTVVDIFDREGRPVRQVAYPAGRRFLGFGNGVVYLVHKDADDLEWLERYGI
jgi:hypothetical protein